MMMMMMNHDDDDDDDGDDDDDDGDGDDGFVQTHSLRHLIQRHAIQRGMRYVYRQIDRQTYRHTGRQIHCIIATF